MEQTSKKRTSKPYSPEFRERAVRLAMEHRDDYQSEAAALTAIAGKLGCSPDSLRVWVRRAQRDGGGWHWGSLASDWGLAASVLCHTGFDAQAVQNVPAAYSDHSRAGGPA